MVDSESGVYVLYEVHFEWTLFNVKGVFVVVPGVPGSFPQFLNE